MSIPVGWGNPRKVLTDWPGNGGGSSFPPTMPNPDWDGIPPAGPGGGAEFPTTMPYPKQFPGGDVIGGPGGGAEFPTPMPNPGPGGGAEFPVPQEESGGPFSKGKDQLWKFIQNNPGLIGGLVGGGAGTWVGKKTGLPGGGMLGGLAGGAIGNRVGKWLLEKYGSTPNNEDLRDNPPALPAGAGNPFGM